MKLTKDQVCVYIENEAQLQEARELLKKYGEDYDDNLMMLSEPIENYLQLYDFYGWNLNFPLNSDIEKAITLQELETILKEQ